MTICPNFLPVGYDIAHQALNYHHSYISKQLRIPTPGGPSPHTLAQTFDGPPSLERSGSEHRRAVTSSLFGQERGLVRDVEPSLMVKKDGMILGKRHYLSLYIFS